MIEIIFSRNLNISLIIELKSKLMQYRYTKFWIWHKTFFLVVTILKFWSNLINSTFGQQNSYWSLLLWFNLISEVAPQKPLKHILENFYQLNSQIDSYWADQTWPVLVKCAQFLDPKQFWIFGKSLCIIFNFQCTILCILTVFHWSTVQEFVYLW